MKRVLVASPCPMCKREGTLGLSNTPVDIPYFGHSLETTLTCDACGFRHADFMILEQKDPMRLTLAGQGEAALQVRVIRSNSGTIRVPEIGFTAEPTPLSESFVSNVEGVLARAKDILDTAMQWHGDDPGKRALLASYLEYHAAILRGEKPFTLILDDPFGNSAIVSESVERRPLTEDEVAQLKTGMVVLDLQDVQAQE